MTNTLVLLSVLTLNIWGLPDIAFRVLCPFRMERVNAICESLKTAAVDAKGWDVVLIQEAWVEADRNTLKKCGYPYSVDFDDPSRPIDSGLLILSKSPLSDTDRLTYPELTDSNSLWQDGEGFAHKSAMIALVHHPVAGNFWIANTHLVSQYSDTDDTYQEARGTQFASYVDWAKQKAGTATPLILGGDWNFGADKPLWSLVKEKLPDFSEAPGADQACTICPPNTMHTHNEGKVDQLFGSPLTQAVSGGTALTTPTDVVPGLPMSVSDHFGWQTTFQIH